MANPKLPGIPEAEQALLYAKLNEYNRGRMSYKEAGAYFVVLPRPGHPTYSVWIYSPTLEKNRLLFIHELSADINESLRMASTLFFFSRRCLLIVEYNEKRMQSNGDDIISFGRYRGHYLHEILKVDPAYLSWIAYKYTPKIPKQERFVAIAQVYHSVHLDIMQRKARQKREAGRFLGNEGEKLEGLNLKVVRVRLEDDPYKTRVMGTSVQFFVRQIVTLTDPPDETSHGSNVYTLTHNFRTCALSVPRRCGLSRRGGTHVPVPEVGRIRGWVFSNKSLGPPDFRTDRLSTITRAPLGK